MEIDLFLRVTFGSDMGMATKLCSIQQTSIFLIKYRIHTRSHSYWLLARCLQLHMSAKYHTCAALVLCVHIRSTKPELTTRDVSGHSIGLGVEVDGTLF